METWEARQYVNAALRGATVKLPAKTDAEAKAVREQLHSAALEQTEPVEINILGKYPKMEVWVRRMIGGRPTQFSCSCGFIGMETQVEEHLNFGKCAYGMRRGK